MQADGARTPQLWLGIGRVRPCARGVTQAGPRWANGWRAGARHDRI